MDVTPAPPCLQEPPVGKTAAKRRFFTLGRSKRKDIDRGDLDKPEGGTQVAVQAACCPSASLRHGTWPGACPLPPHMGLAPCRPEVGLLSLRRQGLAAQCPHQQWRGLPVTVLCSLSVGPLASTQAGTCCATFVVLRYIACSAGPARAGHAVQPSGVPPLARPDAWLSHALT